MCNEKKSISSEFCCSVTFSATKMNPSGRVRGRVVVREVFVLDVLLVSNKLVCCFQRDQT